MCWFTKLFEGTVERPSPSDIVPQGNITVSNFYNATNITIDYASLNIPFTLPPVILNIMGIPDTNSMDGLMDYGHNPLYIKPANKANHQIMVDWLSDEFTTGDGTKWKSGGANDCVYRIMVNSEDDPSDFSKPALAYVIHRISKVSSDSQGRYFEFKGINNSVKDPHKVRDSNILYLNTGVIY